MKCVTVTVTWRFKPRLASAASIRGIASGRGSMMTCPNARKDSRFNLSPIIGPNSQVDPAGQNFIMQQETFIARQFNMLVEMMAAAMMRDSLWFRIVGETW